MMFRRKRRAALVAVAALVAGVPVAVHLTNAGAEVVHGSTGWSILRCKVSDDSSEPKDDTFFRNFFTEEGTGTGGLADYFRDQSGGAIDLHGSTVQGWFTIPFTTVEAGERKRGQKIQDCVDAAAAAGYTVPSDHRTIVVLNAHKMNAGASGDRVLFDAGTMNPRFAAHELLHGYGLSHSWSDDTGYKNASWSQAGEYGDPWDEMSAQATFSVEGPYGATAVGLDAYNRDVLGWLPAESIRTFAADGNGSGQVDISALDSGNRDHPVLLRVPFDPADVNHYYTVEFRRQTGSSAAIPADIILIHEIRDGRSYLVTSSRDGTNTPVGSVDANGARITIDATYGDVATVGVSTDIVGRCIPPMVKRQAQPDDQVCVTPERAGEIATENFYGPGAWVDGFFGPHSCAEGFVWRLATNTDDFCVLPEQYDKAQRDNELAPLRVNAARHVKGPNG